MANSLSVSAYLSHLHLETCIYCTDTHTHGWVNLSALFTELWIVYTLTHICYSNQMCSFLCSTSGIFLNRNTKYLCTHLVHVWYTMQAGCLYPERPGSESGPCRWLQLPFVPSSKHGSSMCVQACVYKHTTVFACIGEPVCVFRGGRVASNAAQWGHHLSLIGTKAGALNLRYNAAPIKTERRHFLPISLMNIKAAATTTHKEKLQPYYFICITCNRQHIGYCIYCLISTSLAVNICWFISHAGFAQTSHVIT